ncbi:MAG: hypothetical protein HLUCCA12_16350 [Rhodobacteraceae bacterium HLUCCA12]|nr:MAG: hypothetical protein HLUCCA12_16350 [Rhodobacteraceae bacterium HLUCCA12]
MRYAWALMVLVLLASCGAPPGGGEHAADGRDGLHARIARECRLLERAHEAIAAQGAEAADDILLGCPGHEDLISSMSLSDMSAATRRANAAVLPDGLRDRGARAETVFRRMITRGVPVAVAEALVTTPEFAAALR